MYNADLLITTKNCFKMLLCLFSFTLWGWEEDRRDTTSDTSYGTCWNIMTKNLIVQPSSYQLIPQPFSNLIINKHIEPNALKMKNFNSEMMS